MPNPRTATDPSKSTPNPAVAPTTGPGLDRDGAKLAHHGARRCVARLDYGRRGVREQVYICPQITRPAFDSAMHSWRNYEEAVCDPLVLANVIARRKPLGFVGWAISTLGDAETRRDAENVMRVMGVAKRDAMKAGLLTWCTARTFSTVIVYNFSLAIPGVVGEMFDLDALCADWRRYLEPAGERAEVAHARLVAEAERIAPMSMETFLDFGAVEVTRSADPRAPFAPEPYDWMRCGLLLGYPPESSAAYALKYMGIAPFGAD